MKKLKNLINRHISLVTFSLIIFIWQISGNLGLLPKFIIPTPLEIARAFIKNYNQLLFHSKITIIEAFIGLSYGILIACLLAVLMDTFNSFNRAIYPLLIITQTVPTIAIAPILVLWLGYGMAPKIVLIIITTTFPIIISILDGFRNADEDTIQLLKLMKANKWQIMKHVKIPNSLSYFYAGLRVSVSYAFIAAVVSEWLGGFEGLGVYMIRTKKLFQYDTMFAIIILVSAISLLSMKIIKISEKKLIKWKYIGENDENN
ncbi:MULTISPECIES: ABC transporter permease [unclassified Gemella]|uniref:ABC transporter permease n=1 Tax=unclassified Gemella TaxID=2624949 RepID=UPI001C0503F4|nr:MULTISPECIES: ABC transporter permease [unclassified Gemella]MBU0278394.1 ABC transporter permease [Gemella sp. zg-1178]QWQ38988.1 ABC transporter permease [Gemella sp. zg-570]